MQGDRELGGIDGKFSVNGRLDFLAQMVCELAYGLKSNAADRTARHDDASAASRHTRRLINERIPSVPSKLGLHDGVQSGSFLEGRVSPSALWIASV